MDRTYYVNLATPRGLETIDEYTGDEAGAQYLIGEYRLVYWRSDASVFLSRRCADDWRDR